MYPARYGVYLIVRNSGKVLLGERVFVPQFGQPQTIGGVSGPTLPLPPAPRRYICRGCYFVYDETSGLPQEAIAPGTAFADIASEWRCPDCGTDKITFRPFFVG